MTMKMMSQMTKIKKNFQEMASMAMGVTVWRVKGEHKSKRCG
jgi:hypothetical protein